MILDMTLVYGNNKSRHVWGVGFESFREVEMLGAFGKGVQGHRRERLSLCADDDFGFPL